MNTIVKFNVGDRVKSAPDSCDVTLMHCVWHAEIYKFKGENDGGGCFETLGTWYPLNDEGKAFLERAGEHDTTPTLRQLWGNHLVIDDDCKDIGDLCTSCHRSTAFGTGLFVNRIPSISETEEGYMCPECLAPEDEEEED